MNLSELFETTDSLGAEITLNGADVEISEPASGNSSLVESVAFHEQELLAILQGKAVDGVGECDNCGDKLIGLRTFDGYINRTCGNCGGWFCCTKQSETNRETRQPVVSPTITAPAGISSTKDSIALHGNLATI